MLDEHYFKKLKEYVGKKINFCYNENEIVIFADAEIKYTLSKFGTRYKLLIIERGVETKLGEFHTKVEMQRNFSLWMKGLIGNGVEYPDLDKFEDIDNINILERLMKQYTSCNLYSINQVIEDKIVLRVTIEGMYELLFVDKDKNKYSIEQNGKVPYIFKRFYTEVVYYREMLRKLKEYEMFFDDKLNYESRLKLLDYVN